MIPETFFKTFASRMSFWLLKNAPFPKELTKWIIIENEITIMIKIAFGSRYLIYLAPTPFILLIGEKEMKTR